MRTITIRKPIWDGLKVGIAEYKLAGGEVAINIDYTDKRGELLWPETFLLTKREAMHYPQQKVRGTTLRIIPIDELRIQREPEPESYDEAMDRRYHEEVDEGRRK